MVSTTGMRSFSLTMVRILWTSGIDPTNTTLAQLFRPLMAVLQHVNALHVQVLEFAEIYDDGASSINEVHDLRLQGWGRQEIHFAVHVQDRAGQYILGPCIKDLGET
jgi:hypothetical protein